MVIHATGSIKAGLCLLSLEPPWQFPPGVLIQINGNPVEIEPGSSRAVSFGFPYQNQENVHRN